MTLTDTTGSRTDALSLEFDLPHAPERVWRALTEPALLAEWLLPSIGFDLAPSAAFMFKTEPVGGWDGVVNCRFREIEPHTRLSYNWSAGDMDWVVTFTLTPTASGTQLTLVQSGFSPDQKKNLAGARYGWKMMGGKLIDLLARIP